MVWVGLALAILAGGAAGFCAVYLYARGLGGRGRNAQAVRLAQELMGFLVEAVSPHFRKDLRMRVKTRGVWRRHKLRFTRWNEIALTLDYAGPLSAERVRSKVRGELGELLKQPEFARCLLNLKYTFTKQAREENDADTARTGIGGSGTGSGSRRGSVIGSINGEERSSRSGLRGRVRSEHRRVGN